MNLIFNLISTLHKRIRKKSSLCILVIVLSISNFSAQQKTDTIVKKTFSKKLWGERLEDGFVFMPIGFHTSDFDFFDVWYTSYSYKGIEFAVFKNSFKDWTLGVIYKRSVYLSEKFHINYAGGIVYGYKGTLGDIRHFPFHNSFLFTGNINPILGIDVDYRITKNISLHSSISPLIIVYGIKYYFK